MKVFQRIQKQYAILGISASNQLTRTLPFSKRVLFGFLSISIEIFSQFVYTFHVANDYMTYIDCICATSATIVIFICLAAIVCRKSTLFEIIHEIEELIDTSELWLFQISTSFYINEQLEQNSILKNPIKLLILGCECSKSEKNFFLKISQQIERLCEIVFMVFMKILVQFIILPKCIASFGVYLISDSGRDSFVLPFPMW